jgi:phage-related baseplate assembly protein
MPKIQKKIMPIDYTHRDFETIRDDLMGIAERFYPDSFQDFSEASFGSLMLDAVSYIGDQLSFYLDYNVNEAFLDTAFQFGNVVRHGRALGYKFTGRDSTYGQVAVFILVPASSAGLGTDSRYLPILKRGTSFSSQNGENFILTENIDFSDPRNLSVAARVDSSTGAPTHYAVKAYGNVVSGLLSTETVEVGTFERFYRATLTTPNVSEVISVYDSEGNQYFEVDYLAQDMVFKEIINPNFKDDNVPSLIKPFLVSRKYTVEHTRDQVTLQFGSGKSGNSDIVANPQNVALDIFGKKYVTDLSFDPTRISQNESFGIVPVNTTLTVVFRATSPSNSNVAVGSLNSVNASNFEFSNRQDLNSSYVNSIISSLEVTNEQPIVGVVTYPSTGEVKQRIFDTFPTQNRAVTQADYENIAYRMHSKYGAIKRVSVQRDPDSQKRNLNMYVVSEDTNGKLIAANSTIKNNLKTWINNYRMINDTVDILDPYILNFGVEFIIKPKAAAEKYTALDDCIEALKTHFSTPFFIGEPIYISQIYEILKGVSGVLDVTKVKVVGKNSGNYSSAAIDISDNLSSDGSYVVVPKNAILELKYPETDIIGKVR